MPSIRGARVCVCTSGAEWFQVESWYHVLVQCDDFSGPDDFDRIYTQAKYFAKQQFLTHDAVHSADNEVESCPSVHRQLHHCSLHRTKSHSDVLTGSHHWIKAQNTRGKWYFWFLFRKALNNQQHALSPVLLPPIRSDNEYNLRSIRTLRHNHRLIIASDPLK